MANPRAIVYWTLDFLKGANVWRNFYETKKINENPVSHFSEKTTQKNLNRILNHAVSKVPFYRKYSDFKALSDFPVTNKNFIRANVNYLFSDDYIPEKLYRVTTSGSTGAPLTVWQDRQKRNRHNAENIYFSQLAGFKLGTRIYYLRVWNEINRKSPFISRMQNIIMQHASDLSDNNLECFLLKLEKDKSTKSILAFSSTLEALALYLVKSDRKINTKVECLLAISESLTDGARDILKRAFRCPVISRYSNMENGIIAQQCGNECGEYHINSSGFYIELLHIERDEPVKEGEIGRIVITDLFNFGMPIIRYDTGDLGIISKESACGKPGQVFKRIEGRRVDFLYDTEGKLLSPHVVTNTMWRYSSEIKQFQLIQNDKYEYVLKINPANSNMINEEKIKSDLKEFLGSKAEIFINYVDEIPLIGSGKRKKIVNNYKKPIS